MIFRFRARSHEGLGRLKIDPTGSSHSSGVQTPAPTAAARVRSNIRSCVIYGRQNVTGAGSPSNSFSPANSHSTDCSTFFIYHPGLVQ